MCPMRWYNLYSVELIARWDDKILDLDDVYCQDIYTFNLSPVIYAIIWGLHTSILIPLQS